MKEYLIKKYKRYVENLEWHLENNPSSSQTEEAKIKLSCFKEILNDLNNI